MRKIEKQREPAALSQWRAANAGTPNCSYRHLSSEAHQAVKGSLIEEQGSLCAYTGHRIRADSCHIEHLKPQAHCIDEETVSYQNIVACYPFSGHPGYGAKQKDNWPSPSEAARFVSPLSDGCEARFRFDAAGRIAPANALDTAATETILRLRLNHSSLEKFRHEAVRPVLALPLKAARSRLADLDRRSRTLTPFCFAVRQMLQRHIRRLEAMRANSSN